MDKKDEIMDRLYECCLNATGAYRALEYHEPRLPGYNHCKQRLDDAILAYENFKKQDEYPNCKFFQIPTKRLEAGFCDLGDGRTGSCWPEDCAFKEKK